MFKVKSFSREFNGEKIVFETGNLATQADASVLMKLGETSVLVTIVNKPPSEDLDFFPLKIDYEERYYANGLISGSRFMRREGRPTDSSVVEGRLIDHAIRPLFPKDFANDTQIVITVLSYDGKNSPGLVGFLGVSALLQIADIPFEGPIVPLRIQKKTKDSDFEVGFNMEDPNAYIDLVVSYLKEGTKVQAIEAHSNIAPESEILEATMAGCEAAKTLESLILGFALECEAKAKNEVVYEKSWMNEENLLKIEKILLPELNSWKESGIEFESAEWKSKMAASIKEISTQFENEFSLSKVAAFASEVQKTFIRKLVLDKKERVDGRKFDEVRELSATVGVLPRVHGSAIFNRGKTQSLSISTLASSTQNLLIQSMYGEEERRYIHHYNFPPYSTGEVGRVGGANRRAIGHGLLAEKAILPVLPDVENFGYTMRVVSEILSSNGSTSMAAACASSLCLMDAGVPITSHVGGIGVGLFVDQSEGDLSDNDYFFLTDIIGQEDFAGYMDYKMTGTRDGVTAIQMELKVKGLPLSLMGKLLEVSKIARMQVLDVMDGAISSPRENLSPYAPKLVSFKVKKDTIGSIIGSGGVMIKSIMETYSCEIDIKEEKEFGMVTIAGLDIDKVEAAKDYIMRLVTPVEIGGIYEGEVTRVEPYGAFIEVAPNQVGLMHVSEYSYQFLDDINNVLKLGDKLQVKILNKDQGKLSLSKKALDPKPEGYVESEPREGRKPSNFGNRSDGGSYNRGRGRGNDRGDRGDRRNRY